MYTMERRLELHEALCEVLGSRNVYFQPPDNVTMRYPCFVYELEEPNVRYADNKAYMITDQYSVKYITRDPDDTKRDEMLSRFKYCRFERPYTADNLHHFQYYLYF